MKAVTNFDMETYIEVVERLAAGYYDDEGEYQPHVGRINQLAVFADYCVKDDLTTENEDVDVNALFRNNAFMDAYSSAVDDYAFGLTFANAVVDAKEIVRCRNSSLIQMANLVKEFVQKYMAPDNIAKLFGDSDRFQEIIKSDPDKVISLFEQATE